MTVLTGACTDLQKRKTRAKDMSAVRWTGVPLNPESTKNHLACRKGLLISAPKSVPKISAPDVPST